MRNSLMYSYLIAILKEGLLYEKQFDVFLLNVCIFKQYATYQFDVRMSYILRNI